MRMVIKIFVIGLLFAFGGHCISECAINEYRSNLGNITLIVMKVSPGWKILSITLGKVGTIGGPVKSNCGKDIENHAGGYNCYFIGGVNGIFYDIKIENPNVDINPIPIDIKSYAFKISDDDPLLSIDDLYLGPVPREFKGKLFFEMSFKKNGRHEFYIEFGNVGGYLKPLFSCSVKEDLIITMTGKSFEPSPPINWECCDDEAN